jgi:hypothetical protein
MAKQWHWQPCGTERVFAIIGRRKPGRLFKTRSALLKLESQHRVIDASETPVTAEARLFATPEFGTQRGGRQGSYSNQA